jgi:Ca2+-binding RTX toxin-like protein
MAYFFATSLADIFGGTLADSNDIVSYAASAAGVSVNLSLVGAQATGGSGSDTFTSIEHLIGSNFNDTVSGSSANNALDGGAGIDTVSYATAGAGVSVSLSLVGVAQNTFGAGIDTLVNFENLTGSFFNDTLSGNSGNNVLNGLGGTDTVSYANAIAAVTVDLSLVGAQNTVGAGTDTLLNFENVIGSGFNDTLRGNAGSNVLDGSLGIDTASYSNAGTGVTVSLDLLGLAQNTVGAGIDTLFSIENLIGSSFNDTLSGNAGANTLNGGAGIDTVTYATAGAGVSVSLNTAAAQATGGAGSDTLSGFENLTGSNFSDTLTGNGLNNSLDGGSGNDTINGLQGNDILTGGSGSDRFVLQHSGDFNFDTVISYSTSLDEIGLHNLLDGSAVAGITGLAFVGGPSTGNILNAAQFFKGVGTGNNATDLSGIYANSSTGDIWYNPTFGTGGDSLRIANVGASVVASTSFTNAEFIYVAI